MDSKALSQKLKVRLQLVQIRQQRSVRRRKLRFNVTRRSQPIEFRDFRDRFHGKELGRSNLWPIKAIFDPHENSRTREMKTCLHQASRLQSSRYVHLH